VSLEREAVQQGASKLVIEGRLVKAIFSSEKTIRAYARLGYSFQKLADGTVLISKNL
jgi:hypothetical protein